MQLDDESPLGDPESGASPPDSPAAAEKIEDASSPAAEPEDAAPRQTLLQRIGKLTIAQKLHLATLGSREERLILIRDQNRLISRAVASSPKATESEVELYASMTDLAEDVFRIIAKSQTFMKSYGVVRALVRNPHVPLDISLPLMIRLNAKDLKEVEVDKNMATALRNVATKLLRRRH
ncbi:MAG TPA: hypothetical protein VKM93_14800 [Terriglobia bacterium]|nr:hypothetical protein [Terriglobia bacterium]